MDVAVIEKMIEEKYIGMKVICRSNENKPLNVGVLKYFNQYGIPVVEINGDIYFIMGITIPHTKEMEDFLNTLAPKRQWEILRDISLTIKDIKFMKER